MLAGWTAEASEAAGAPAVLDFTLSHEESHVTVGTGSTARQMSWQERVDRGHDPHLHLLWFTLEEAGEKAFWVSGYWRLWDGLWLNAAGVSSDEESQRHLLSAIRTVRFERNG